MSPCFVRSHIASGFGEAAFVTTTLKALFALIEGKCVWDRGVENYAEHEAPLPCIPSFVVKTCHMRYVHLLWTVYLNGQILRILDFRRKVYVSYDFRETTFCDDHLESSVAVDKGKDIRYRGVKNYAEHEVSLSCVSPCIVKTCHMRYVHPLWTMYPNGHNLRILDFKTQGLRLLWF